MFNVSEGYKQTINGFLRRSTCKLEIYFNGDNNAPDILLDDDVVTISLLEEAYADNTRPLGSVSSNELLFTIKNINKKYTPTNINGSYYGKLVPNVKVKAYYGLDVNGVIEYVPLGTFRTGDWECDSDTVEVSSVCFDKLIEIRKLRTPQLSLKKNVILKDFLELLFTSIGLTQDEYVIDSSLTYIIPYAWYAETVGEVLQDVAVFGSCFIYVDRLGRLCVKDLLNAGQSVFTMTDADQIIKLKNQVKYLSVSSVASVTYDTYSVGKKTDLLSMNNISMQVGINELNRVTIPKKPIFKVTGVSLVNSKNCSVSSLNAGTSDISVTIDNSGLVAEAISIQVDGYELQRLSKEVEVVDSNALSAIGYKDVKVTSYLCQTEADANRIGTATLSLIKDPAATIELEIRGNPAIEVSDVITVQDATNEVFLDLIVVRNSINFNGDLTSNLVCIKKNR